MPAFEKAADFFCRLSALTAFTASTFPTFFAGAKRAAGLAATACIVAPATRAADAKSKPFFILFIFIGLIN